MRLNQGSEWEARIEEVDGISKTILIFEGIFGNKLVFRVGPVGPDKKIEFTAPEFIFQCQQNKIRPRANFSSLR